MRAPEPAPEPNGREARARGEAQAALLRELRRARERAVAAGVPPEELRARLRNLIEALRTAGGRPAEDGDDLGDE